MLLFCEITERQKTDHLPQVLENHINLWGMCLLQTSSALDRCLYHSGLSHLRAVSQTTVSSTIANVSPLH